MFFNYDLLCTELSIQVENWFASEMPALLTDLVISMNDRYAYVAGWLHGCIWQLDISDPFRTSVQNKVRNVVVST